MSPLPTILIVGATGNTGQGVINTLPGLIKGQNLRILALTRKLASTSKDLTSLEGVEWEEKDWTSIDADWLKERNIVKASVASHNEPSQFTDESSLYVNMLSAGVKYVVRVSTHPQYMSHASPIYYGRTHVAIEDLLSQPDFDALSFTSLKPTGFTTFLTSALQWVEAYRKDQDLKPLHITPSKDGRMAYIDPFVVGVVGAHLLSFSDADQAKHHNKRYELNGPADISGEAVVRLVEKFAGVQIPKDKVVYKV
jgi:hypothetical protein